MDVIRMGLAPIGAMCAIWCSGGPGGVGVVAQHRADDRVASNGSIQLNKIAHKDAGKQAAITLA